MSKINVDKATVHLTEVTLSELNKAVQKAKDEGATKVTVATTFSQITFIIDVAAEANMMESLGYRPTGFVMPVSDRSAEPPVPEEGDDHDLPFSQH